MAESQKQISVGGVDHRAKLASPDAVVNLGGEKLSLKSAAACYGTAGSAPGAYAPARSRRSADRPARATTRLQSHPAARRISPT